jgi:hypothetical protein
MKHAILLVLCAAAGSPAADEDYPIRPVPFTDVRLDDVFWRPRIDLNRTVTVPVCFRKCEEYRIKNFARAAKRLEGKYQGDPFDDSDVYKVVEGAAYCLATDRDPGLEKYCDDLIALFAAAQEPDGYLYTSRTIHGEKAPGRASDKRWVNDCGGYKPNLGDSHELYNAGHMYEAAVAHFQATGKRTFLDLAVKHADLVAKTWGPDGLKVPPGHQEIELALFRLGRATGDRKYFDLAKFLLECRGRGHRTGDAASYYSDHLPVTQQREVVGHAVRSGYMYSGMTDVAAILGDKAYAAAVDALWNDTVNAKLYLHGGVGAVAGREGFGDPYDLPNDGYNETCAAIALSLWNQRLFLLHGDSKYADVLERTIYNGFLSGVSLSGDRFFYPNPLVSAGGYARSPWFGCACCPVNVCRFLPSVPGFAYAVRGDALYANLYAAGTASATVAGTKVALRQETRYPWDGTVKLAVAPEKAAAFSLRLRIPGWAQGRPVPTDLYRYADEEKPAVKLSVNGTDQPLNLDKGYAVVTRTWNPGDAATLVLPMPVRRVVAHEKVKADAGLVALERGPLVFCVEGIDHGGKVRHLVLPDDAKIAVEHRPDLLGGVTVLTGTVRAAFREKGGAVKVEPAEMTAVPYYAWCNRGAGALAVWLARTPGRAQPLPPPTPATTAAVSASHTEGSREAVNDGIEPKDSCDHDIPRFTWWDRKGSEQWIQLDLEKPVKIGAVEVYWFSDRRLNRGCDVPESWSLLWKDGEDWKPAEGAPDYGTAPDRYNRVTFTPVTAKALRLKVKLRPGYSGGVLEWKVEAAK